MYNNLFSQLLKQGNTEQSLLQQEPSTELLNEWLKRPTFEEGEYPVLEHAPIQPAQTEQPVQTAQPTQPTQAQVPVQDISQALGQTDMTGESTPLANRARATLFNLGQALRSGALRAVGTKNLDAIRRGAANVNEALANPQVIAALGQFGAALSSPGSVGERLGTAATQMAQSQIFRKALSDALAGREVDMSGLTPEQQVRVRQVAQQTQLFNERESAARKRVLEEKKGKIYSTAMEKALKGEDYDLGGLSIDERNAFYNEFRERKKFAERETPEQARERNVAAEIKIIKSRSDMDSGKESPDIKRAYSNIERILNKVDPSILSDNTGEVDPAKILQVLAGGGKVMNEKEKTVLGNSLKYLESLGLNTFGLKSSDFLSGTSNRQANERIKIEW